MRGSQQTVDTTVTQGVSMRGKRRAELTGHVGQKGPGGETRDLNTGTDEEDRRGLRGRSYRPSSGALTEVLDTSGIGDTCPTTEEE